MFYFMIRERTTCCRCYISWIECKNFFFYIFNAWGSKPRAMSVPCTVPLGYVWGGFLDCVMRLISFMLHCKSYYQTFRPKSNIVNKTCGAERHCWLHSSECDFCTCIEYHSSIWMECHGQMLSAPAYVSEVMGLNIDLDTLYPDYSFLWLCLLHPRDFQHSNTK